jgi:catechol 2,3-dioxygenase-like lactoylglutathione lyase family enzyme
MSAGLTAIQHVLVLSDDIDATRDFYRDVLGMENGERPPFVFAGHWLYAGGVPCIHVADRAEYAAHTQTLGAEVRPHADGAGPIDHIAFGATGYEEIVARLELHGVDALVNTVPGLGLRQLFVNDPNGVRIEINVAPEDGA